MPNLSDWENYLEKQKQICKKHNSKWNPINKELKIGCSDDLLSEPLNGLRHPQEGDTTGWYIWSGEYSDKEDFFKPICAKHLLKIRPEIINYLGLDTGFRFFIDSNGYEDVWYDENLLNI